MKYDPQRNVLLTWPDGKTISAKAWQLHLFTLTNGVIVTYPDSKEG